MTEPATPTLTSQAVEEALTELMARRDIPGAAFAAVQGDETIATAALGTANRNTDLVVTEDTLFQAGSIGKVYTATLIMQLVDEGKLDLDVPVRNYLPDLRFADLEVSRVITTRHLLTHSAGIDGDRIDPDGSLFGRGDDCIARYVASLSDLPQIVAPGKIWSYCNSGYVVLGRLVEVLTGEVFETALKTRLFEPLGLKHTVCFAEEAILHNVAVGHMPQPEGDPAVTTIYAIGRSLGPAGVAIICSIGDLLAFAQMHLRGGLAADGTRVLSEESVRLMQAPQIPCPERQLLGDHWGLGWALRTEAGPLVAAHDGNTYGQTSFLRLVPEHNLAFGLLTNRNQANAVIAELSHAVIDAWAGIETPGKPEVKDLQLSTSRYTGVYANVAAQIVVTESEGRLYAVLQVNRDTADVDSLDPTPRPLKIVDEETLLLPFAEYDDELQMHFLEPDDAGRWGYLHMGARLYRRVPTAA